MRGPTLDGLSLLSSHILAVFFAKIAHDVCEFEQEYRKTFCFELYAEKISRFYSSPDMG